MQGTTPLTVKKKTLVGAGVVALLVAATITGIYTTSHAETNQLSTATPVLEAADINFDVKVESGAMEPESVTSLMESNNSSSSTQQSTGASPKVDVTVNGTPIDVPENGTVHKEVTTEDGSAKINISSQSNTSSGHTRTRSSIKVDSDSSVRIRTETRE